VLLLVLAAPLLLLLLDCNALICSTSSDTMRRLMVSSWSRSATTSALLSCK
jgi:hypothetical protein